MNKAMKKLSKELVSEPGEMLNILAESKANGTAVGIHAPNLGNEIFVTGVEDILIDTDITIVLRNYDSTGYMLETNKLKLGEISGVCAFTSHFENPYMKSLKNNEPL